MQTGEKKRKDFEKQDQEEEEAEYDPEIEFEEQEERNNEKIKKKSKKKKYELKEAEERWGKDGEEDEELLEKIRSQIEFYFSDSNVLKDTFIRKILDTGIYWDKETEQFKTIEHKGCKFSRGEKDE